MAVLRSGQHWDVNVVGLDGGVAERPDGSSSSAVLGGPSQFVHEE